ncbi:hypothetical protein ATY75_27430 [Rhizobium sp. N122]|uniref:RDD family protein n=1 Tax=Rhizobium sp. N122 TaxID=1764272 RepID=UPI000B5A4906|nr:RDD family protein [Rhizobium sp. N122]OWV82555.1 hypothetical protein ATY75_27430 [Rhizobium sp. N122]
MTDWYYVFEEERRGPVGADELQERIKNGQIKKETYLWHEGMDAWQPAIEHPEFASAFVMPPPFPVSQPAKRPPPAFEPRAGGEGMVISSRPWPRFWARFIDNLLFVPLLAFAIGLLSALYAPDIYLQIATINSSLFGLLLLPFVALFLALCMVATGSTPGKAIVGVRVPAPSGRNRIGFFLGREFKVWAAGLGLGIPFVALFTQIGQYRRLAEGKAASYDEGNPAVVANPSKVRLGAAIVVVMGLFAGNIVLRVEDQQASRNLAATQTWVNPVTKKPATIGKTWRVEEMTTDSGRTFYFASNELLAEALLGYQRLSSEGMEPVVYADAIKKAVASDVHINTEWKPLTVQGIPALRATGKSVKISDASVEVTIVVTGRDAWRTLVFARGNSPAQSAEKDKLVQAIFGTAD